MRFNSINVSNFRQYRKMDISFPKIRETDLHVIVASNGIGKTNMLNAINWCLYGDEPHLGDEDDSLSICNYIALNEARDNGERTACVSVSITTETEQGTIIFTRKVEVNCHTRFPQPDKFEAKIIDKTGNAEFFENESADEIVNRYLPRKIRQYFFFDGEQLYNYFGKGQATTHVKDSIHEIAQINVVTNTKKHLQKIIEEYTKTVSSLNPRVDELRQKLQELREQEEEFKNNIDEINKSIEESEETIAELTQKISGTESVVEDDRKYNENITTIEELEEELKGFYSDLYKFVREYYVLLSLFEINKSTKDYIQSKYDKGSLPPDINIDFIKESLADHKCCLCKSPTTAEVEEYFKNLIKQYDFSTKVSHKLVEIKNDVSRSVDLCKNYEKEKNEIFEKIRKTNEKIESLTSENETLYKRISVCSSVEEIQLWMKQREEHRRLKDINNKKLGSYEEKLNNLKADIEKYKTDISKATEDDEKCFEIKEYIDFATEALDIVSSIESEIITDVRSKMQSETMNMFEELIWKKNTYGRIELSEDYRLRIYHKITGESCLGSCSAAERELLALAFTIALHKVSGHDCLLFIDTPVGRVSDINREKFARSLISVSEQKQLILAFTPSEYSEEIRKYFDNSILSSISKFVSPDEEKTLKEDYNG